MSALTVPFLMPKTEEVVPDFVALKDKLTSSSVVEERYTATMVPSSGDQYSVGGSKTKLMILRVANQNDYIDTSTMVLNFLAKGDGANAASYAIDDHIFSLVDTINVKVGGQTVEVLNNVGHLMNTLIQGSMPSSYYAQNGAFEGLYIYDKTTKGAVVGDAAVNAASTSPNAQNSTMISQRWATGNRWFTAGRYYSVPLTLLGICRLPTLFAARNFQDLTIEILFRANPAGSLWVVNPVAAAPGTAVTVEISDVTLTYDCCRMSADYYALMDNELKMPNGSGVAYAIDTYQVQPATIAAGSAGNAPLNRIVVAKGTRFLKSVYGVSKLQTAETSFAWRNCSTSGNFGFTSYQVIINSKRYPQLQIQSSALAFQELQKAYNQLGSTAAGGMIDWYNYVGNARIRANDGAGTYQDAKAVAASKDGTYLGILPGDESMFQIGVNLEQFLTNQPDAGGINTSTSGYQIAIELAQSAVGPTANNDSTAVGANLTHYVILHFTRILTLKAGAVEILD